MSKTVEEIVNHVGVGWCGNPFCNKEPYTVDEAIEAINKLLIEAEKRGVAWTIGIIDEMHEMDIEKNGGVRDSQYKGIKNGIRAMYEQDTGNGDPAPNYPINVELQSTLKPTTEKEQ